MTVYLSADEVIQIHNEILKETGGYRGIISRDGIDSIVSQTKRAKAITRKFTVMLSGIIKKHSFIDGNKRTGLILAETLLRLDNKKLKTTKKNLWDVLHKISDGEMNISQVERWAKGKISE